jgi:hypothetical protein
MRLFLLISVMVFCICGCSSDPTSEPSADCASSPSTLYESASTSKLITAVVILSLVDEGVLSLDDHPQD